MRDCPSRVISCSSFTDSSSFSSNATMRSRVGSDSARRDFRVEDIRLKGFTEGNKYFYRRKQRKRRLKDRAKPFEGTAPRTGFPPRSWIPDGCRPAFLLRSLRFLLL